MCVCPVYARKGTQNNPVSLYDTQLMLAQGESDYRYAAKDIKEGLQHVMPAARTRANAVYYGFIVLSLGLIVTVCPSFFNWLTSRAVIRCPRPGHTSVDLPVHMVPVTSVGLHLELCAGSSQQRSGGRSGDQENGSALCV